MKSSEAPFRARLFRKFSAGILVMMIGLYGCANTPPPEPAPPESLIIRQVSEVPGFSKQVLFEQAKVWVAASFSDDLDVIRHTDRGRGIIMAKTFIPHQRPRKIGGPERFELRFTLVIETKDSKIRTTFTDLQLMGQFAFATILKSDMEVIRPRFENAVSALVASFKTTAPEDDDW